MEEYTYNITVQGNGTQLELTKTLRDLADAIEQANGVAELDGAEWEDSTLITTINEGVESKDTVEYIKKVIANHGTVSCFELEDESSPMISSIGDTMLMVEGYCEDGVDTATYVNDIETNTGYLTYEELDSDVLSEIAMVMSNYEADCIKTNKRISD